MIFFPSVLSNINSFHYIYTDTSALDKYSLHKNINPSTELYMGIYVSCLFIRCQNDPDWPKIELLSTSTLCQVKACTNLPNEGVVLDYREA